MEHRSFTDAETREETVEHILGSGLAGQRVNRGAGEAQLLRRDEQVGLSAGGVKMIAHRRNPFALAPVQRQPAVDIVVMPRPGFSDMPFDTLQADYLSTLRRYEQSR